MMTINLDSPQLKLRHKATGEEVTAVQWTGWNKDQMPKGSSWGIAGLNLPGKGGLFIAPYFSYVLMRSDHATACSIVHLLINYDFVDLAS